MSSKGQPPRLLSCTACRQRKVKCDKKQPCSACVKLGLECISPDRTRKRRKRPVVSQAREAELLKRLHRLEGLVGLQAENNTSHTSHSTIEGNVHSDQPKKAPDANGIQTPLRTPPDDERLGSAFWISLTNEVEGLRDVLDQSSDEDEPADRGSELSSQDNYQSHNIGLLFGHGSQPASLLPLHPTSPQIQKLLGLYMTNVDPVFKIMHLPTLESSVMKAATSLDAIENAMEALLFAIYYAAINAMSDDECHQVLGQGKGPALLRFRHGTESALDSAGFLSTTEITTLQAFVIYLMGLRCHDGSRYGWTLVAVAVRIGQAFGLHRDVPHSNFTPFEIEMRRRLWWQICVLDMRASDDRSTEPMILNATYNTPFPANIDDSDISRETKNSIVGVAGCTEMTFCLMTNEIIHAARRLQYEPPISLHSDSESTTLSMRQKENIVNSCFRTLENDYFAKFDITIPIFWVASLVGRLIMSKLWLLIQYPLQECGRMVSRPQTMRENSLRTACSILEVVESIEQDAAAAKWRWYFRTFVQWHPVAVILAELCVLTQGPDVERAWRIIDSSYERFAMTVADSRNGALWRPMKKLLARAQQARSESLSTHTQRSDTQLSDLQIGAGASGLSYSYNPPQEGFRQFEPLGQLATSDLQYWQPPQSMIPEEVPVTNDSSFQTLTQDLDMIDWSQWDEFIQDAQFDNLSGDGTGGQLPANFALF